MNYLVLIEKRRVALGHKYRGSIVLVLCSTFFAVSAAEDMRNAQNYYSIYNLRITIIKSYATIFIAII